MLQYFPQSEIQIEEKDWKKCYLNQLENNTEINQFNYLMMRLVITGDMGVGRSAITIQYCNGVFVEYMDPNIEDYWRKSNEGKLINII